MLPAEIVLIILGFASISVSFFLANKNKDDPDEEATGRDIWTEKDEETIIKHVDEILSERGMELVDTTEDQMSRICNEKIMAFDEFSKQVLEKINANHEEVVFMYNMLGERKKEILEDTMKETVEKSVPVISEVEGADESDVVINVTPSADSGLNRAKRKAEAVIVAPKSDPDNSEITNIYTTDRPIEKKEVKSGIARAKEAINQEKQRPVSEKTGLERAANHSPRPQPAMRNTQESMVSTTVEEAVTDAPGQRNDVSDVMGRPSRESVMKSLSETSGSRSNEDVEDRIRQLYRAGKSVMDISKEMNLGQGEVKLMIALLKKRS